MSTAYQVTPMPIYRGSKPVRDRKYLSWIKRFPCVACGGTRWVDPHHCGAHALGQKASDTQTLPLCRTCHDALHKSGPAEFARVTQLDFAALIHMFNHLWQLKGGR
jgi:hypothetical protein